MTRAENDGMDWLDAMLAEARARAPEPGPDLAARVLADAQALSEGRRRSTAVPQGGWRRALSALAETFGGWPALGGMATAGLAGLWIGFFGLGPAGQAAVDLWAEDLPVELMPEAALFALASGTEG